LAPAEFALSPDGRYIAFIASGDGAQRIWLRPLDKTEAQPMPGTDGANSLFWSADSRSIGFEGSGKLYRIDIAGGRPQALANTPVALGGAWNADGAILFSTTSVGPLFRTAASGSEPVAVTHLIAGQLSHRLPQFLPDGRRFLFYAPGTSEASGLYLGSLDGGEPKRLTTADSQGAYLEPDLVIFERQGTLLGRRLDIGKGELTGDPFTIASPAGLDVQRAFSVAHGRVAYRSGSSGRFQLAWFDRNGKPLGTAGGRDVNSVYPELSPDGRRVALTRAVQDNMDIFLMDLLRGGALTRLTFDPASDVNAIWSPDGTRVAFTSNRKGTFNMYTKASSGVGTDEPLLESPNIGVPQDWSKDGRFLLYYEFNSKMGSRDLWAMQMDGKERKTFPVAQTPFDESLAQFSPDGRWVAYQTSESGRFEIVVQTFPEATGKWQVSSGGGEQARWRADGKELYFIAPDGKLMAAPVMTSNSAFEPGTPVALFQTRMVTVGVGGALIHPQYAVSTDGRFLINQPAEESTAAPITLILNWKPHS
jgi:Tol biopolymer transport system component